MQIAIFDYFIVSNRPSGSCNREIIRGLCDEHQFTVFAVEFENPCPDRVRFVRVPVPTRPLALLFVAYHLMAPVVYFLYRLRTGVRFDLVHMVETKLSFGDVSYAHFCHRAYLRYHWKTDGVKGLRGVARWLDHWLRAQLEPLVFRKVRWVVVPSQGLKQDLEGTYPFAREKVVVIPNPIDLERMTPPSTFSRKNFRQERGVTSEDFVLVFVALGNFEHKGLRLILEALTELRDPRIKLWVVGGKPDLVTAWKRKTRNLKDQVFFFGMQKDVRPFLWGADAFVFPSVYEMFPLATLEAAAAGLPLIVTRVYGVEEFMKDGETGIFIERSVQGVIRGIQYMLNKPPEERLSMGQKAKDAVSRYSVPHFHAAWRNFLAAYEERKLRGT